MHNFCCFDFSSESPDDLLNSLETELVQKDTELEKRDIELKLQNQKIESLREEVCCFKEQLTSQSHQILLLETEIKNLNQKLELAE